MRADLLTNCGPIPRPADPDRAATGIEHWLDAADRQGDAGLADFAAWAAASGPVRALLDAVFGNSPFLGHLLCRHQDFARTVIENGAKPALAAVHADIAVAAGRGEPIGPPLRRAKQQAALAIALADILGLWPLPEVTGQLSRMAAAGRRRAM